jgi:hypothetical protein
MAEQLELFSEGELQQQEAGSIGLPEAKPIIDAEWCFQFFDNEPVVFAWAEDGSEPTPLTITLNPIEEEGLSFRQNGMLFKIFPRTISEETKEKRKEQINESKN